MSCRNPESDGWTAVCWYSCATPTSSCRFSSLPCDSIVRSASSASRRPVGAPLKRDGVIGVVDHLQVRDHVLDLGPLVEARAADHLVGDALADEHILEHPRLRVRPVEDGDLAPVVALLDECGDLGGDEAPLCMLILDRQR